MLPGDLCRLYRNTGTDASPTWIEIEKAKDVSWPISIGEADVSARDCEYKLSEANLIGIELTFGYEYERGTDAIYDALMADALQRTKRIYAIADGDIAGTGTRYLKFPGQIFSIENEEPLEGSKSASFTIKPTRLRESGNLIRPQFVTV